MALPMLRGCNCSRLPSVLSRFLKPEHVVLPRPNKTTRLAPTLSVGVVSTVRAYSSDRGGGKQNQKVVVLGFPNPLIWFRTRIYYFLIRVYFDKEFKIEEFTEGSKRVGRKFASILMRYWYLTSARLPEESLEGTRIFQVAIGGEGEPETKRLLTANYEFQREFTKGVSPDWTITRIEHSKLLD
ncbi:unnamed protein product [Coregonus sp. 'balchen']|nr:unnamed protein product [Coregonus sp. 'balchen']